MFSRISFAGGLNRGLWDSAVAKFFTLSFTLAAISLSGQVFAQDQDADEPRRGTASALMEEVIVTARKREEESQDVPIAISAYSAEQLEALKVRDLRGLSVAMPNVAMDDIATSRGVANFSIRGLGINSSIPGIDPTVGVFIDGVYLAQNAGVVFDMFDIASIEVLRGPQGTLFGRNVTGGAVLVNTKLPGDEFAVSFRGAVDGNSNGDGGTNYYLMGAVDVPMGDAFRGRLSLYHNEDDGWFENLATGEDHGAASTTIFRPVFVWQPADTVQLSVRWEHMETDGDGPASQSHPNGLGIPGTFIQSFYPRAFERDSFDFAIDERGFLDADLDHVSARLDWDVGRGTITNILAYRDYYATTYGDIDAQPVWLFHAGSINDSEQWSNELRYSVPYADASNLTVGFYWLDNEIKYTEQRDLLGIALVGTPIEGNPALTQSGGGVLELDSKAGFAAVDHALDDQWTINAGVRYTVEEKDAQIATLVLPMNTNNKCSITPHPDYPRICNFDFVDSDQWTAWSGKLGFTYAIADDRRLYGHWTQGHRSGGYNLRNTSTDIVNQGPGPFDQETVTTWELGYKSELGGRGRFNAAVFWTEVDNMQREVNLPSPTAGVLQIIRNTADAQIPGFEVDGAFALAENTVLLASLGWVDPQYTRVIFDLNGDGLINQADEELELPRAAEWTYSIGVNHDWFWSGGQVMSFRVNYAYRDDSFYTDNNLGFLLDQEILDAGIDFSTPDGNWIFSLYGKNLTDSVNHGGDTQLPALLGPVPTGGTFSPLLKGRVVGFEVTFSMGQ